jgi:hypothetical protein
MLTTILPRASQLNHLGLSSQINFVGLTFAYLGTLAGIAKKQESNCLYETGFSYYNKT